MAGTFQKGPRLITGFGNPTMGHRPRASGPVGGRRRPKWSAQRPPHRTVAESPCPIGLTPSIESSRSFTNTSGSVHGACTSRLQSHRPTIAVAIAMTRSRPVLLADLLTSGLPSVRMADHVLRRTSTTTAGLGRSTAPMSYFPSSGFLEKPNSLSKQMDTGKQRELRSARRPLSTGKVISGCAPCRVRRTSHDPERSASWIVVSCPIRP